MNIQSKWNIWSEVNMKLMKYRKQSEHEMNYKYECIWICKVNEIYEVKWIYKVNEIYEVKWIWNKWNIWSEVNMKWI